MDTTTNIKNNKKSFITIHHNHPVLFLSSEEKGYSSEGWYCDICSNSYKAEVKSMHCKICGWDMCSNCFYNDFQYLE